MALMATIFRLHRPITIKEVTKYGRKTLEKVVPATAKPRTLPAAPDLKHQDLYRSTQ